MFFGGTFGMIFHGQALAEKQLVLQAENLRPCPCREKSCAGDNSCIFYFNFHSTLPHLRLYPINLPDITFIASRCLDSNRGVAVIAWFLRDGPAVRGDLYKC